MTVRSTIAYWRAEGMTPDEAMAGLGVRRPLASTWAEVEVIAAMREREMSVELLRIPRRRAVKVAA